MVSHSARDSATVRAFANAEPAYTIGVRPVSCSTIVSQSISHAAVAAGESAEPV